MDHYSPAFNHHGNVYGEKAGGGVGYRSYCDCDWKGSLVDTENEAWDQFEDHREDTR